MLKNLGATMTVLYPNPCYNEVCHTGTPLYMNFFLEHVTFLIY